MRIGVLALQGAVTEHIASIEKTGAQGLPIKRVEELDGVDGLIIPGGESTTIGKLMRKYGFIEAIRAFADQGKPIFGTCAGMIVLAKRIAGDEAGHLELMDITVARNAFGRQRKALNVTWRLRGLLTRCGRYLSALRLLKRWARISRC